MNLDTRPYRKRLKLLRDDFSTWRDHYRELMDYICPRKGEWLDNESKSNNDGKKRHTNIINFAGGRAAEICANMFQGGLTRPSSEWFEVETSEPDLNKYKPVQEYLSKVAQLIRKAFSNTNFYSAVKSFYHELCVFGTGVVHMEKDDEFMMRIHPYTAGQYYLGQSPAYVVDTCYRRFCMTVEQLVRKFGLDNCSDPVKAAYGQNQLDKWMNVIHVIQPRVHRDIYKLTSVNMPWASVYFEENGDEDMALRVSGYPMQPFSAGRWFRKGTDVYGWSPGMDELGDIKMLQKLELKKLKALDKHIDPPLNAPIGLRGANLTPHGLNWHDPMAGSWQLSPVYQINPNLDHIRGEIFAVVERIRSGFWNDIFLLISNSQDDNKTATQIAAEQSEQLMLLGPVVESVQEFLSVLIERAYQIMSDYGLLPPAPEELRGREWRVKFVGILAQAQRMIDIASIERWIAFGGNLEATEVASGRPPSAMDAIDIDGAVYQVGERLGVPPEVIRDRKEVEQIRAQRQAQIQAQQEAAQAAQLADVSKTMSETKIGEKSFLEETMGGR